MPELQIGQEFAGHRIEAVAGRGGMGVVYRAVHLALDRQVALKLISGELADNESFRERFKRESKTAASIQHPNVIPIYHAGEDEGLLYITMHYVEGTDLRQLIAQQGALQPQLAAELIAQTGSALDAAHGRGLIHRDVKPGNVLIASIDGKHRAYLTDFGLTKQAGSESGLTKTGMFVGTLDYIAPEQLQGKGIDARADVYALGCVLYQALTGRVPYPRDSEPAKIWAHMGEDPPSVTEVAPQVPRQFEEIVHRSMAKDPEARYPSAGDLGRAALAAAQERSLDIAERSVATGEAAPGAAPTMLGAGATATGTAPGHAPTTAAGATDIATPPPPPGAPVAVPPPPPPPPPPPTRSRTPLLIGGALAAVALVAVLGLLLLGGGGEDDGGGTGEVVGSGPLDSRVFDLDSGEGALWIARADGAVGKFDPGSNEEVERITPRHDASPGLKPAATAITVGAGSVWVDAFADAVVRIDAKSGQQTNIKVPEASEVSQVAVDDRFFWLLAPKKRQLTRVNVGTNRVENVIEVPKDAVDVGAGNGFGYLITTSGDLYFIAEGDKRLAEPANVAKKAGGIAFVDGTLYLSALEGSEETIKRLDAESGTEGGSIKVGKGLNFFDVGPEAAWATYPVDRTVKRFDLGSGEPVGQPIKLDQPPGFVEASDLGVFVVSGGDKPTVTHIEP